MGCLTSFVTVPLAALAWILGAGGLLLVAGGFKVKHPALCEVGACVGLAGAVLGAHVLGGLALVAGVVGWLRFRSLPPPGGRGGAD